MIINILLTRKLISSTLVFLFPVLVSCSVLRGSSASTDPAVVAQEQQVRYLEQEVQDQKRRTDEAEQLYKRERDLLSAKRSELKAAERLLKVYRDQAK